MFLNIFTPPQQRVFLETARAVVEQDGEVADAEQALLDGLRSECGVDQLPPMRRDVPDSEKLRLGSSTPKPPGARSSSSSPGSS